MRHWKPVTAFIVGAFPLVALWVVLANSIVGGEFGTGAVNLPTIVTTSMYGYFLGVAAISVPLWRTSIQAVWPRADGRLRVELGVLTDRRWVALTAFGAFAAAALMRIWVLRNAPMTDDEGAYQFGARLLLDGKTWVESPEPRLFFDNFFLINDGRMYPQYPMGWPALLAIGIPIGLEGFINPLLSAATIPAIFGLATKLRGRSAGRLATVLFVISPMLSIGAATMMSHTSALCVTSWALWVVVTRIDEPSLRWDATLAGLLGASVFIRPTVGLTFGIVLAPWWLWRRVIARDAVDRMKRVTVFCAVAAVFGAAFLGVNASQTGSPWKLAYQRSLEYVQENRFRFSPWHSAGAFMQVASPSQWVEVATSALLRLNADLFFIPAAFIPVAFVRWSRKYAVIMAAATVCFLGHTFAYDVGVDAFAPVHFFELGGPLIILVAIGICELRERIQHTAVATTLVAILLVSWATIIPMRLLELNELAKQANAPQTAVDEAGLSNAVVFQVGLALQCRKYSKHFVWAHPYNSPDLSDDVLRLNHLSVELDRKLMATRFPDRAGYLLLPRSNCTMGLIPLDSDDAAIAPPSPHLPR